MLTALLSVFAQTTPPGTAPAQAAPSLGDQLTPVVAISAMALVFYFVMWRPMQRDRKQRESLLNQVKKNDEVILSSGIYGTIIAVAEEKGKDEITVKIADNTRIRVIKSAIARNLTNEEAA